MTPQAALLELLARVGARNGAAVLVSDEELCQWPAEAVAAMKSQGLLAKTRPATSVVCTGCEQQCSGMRVHTGAARPSGSASFIVCDKRSDINRVPVSVARLTQWRCGAEAVRGFVAQSLGLRLSDKNSSDGDLLIGIATGDKRRQMLCLRAEGELPLVAANNAMPLPELVGFRDGEYSFDGGLVRQLVDSATTADSRYTRSNARLEARKLDTQARYKSWSKAFRTLKKRHPNKSGAWCSQQIAKQDIAAGRSAETIRKHIRKVK